MRSAPLPARRLVPGARSVLRPGPTRLALLLYTKERSASPPAPELHPSMLHAVPPPGMVDYQEEPLGWGAPRPPGHYPAGWRTRGKAGHQAATQRTLCQALAGSVRRDTPLLVDGCLVAST